MVQTPALRSVVYMLYCAFQSQWANLGHPGQGEDEGLDETVWRITVSVDYRLFYEWEKDRGLLWGYWGCD